MKNLIVIIVGIIVVGGIAFAGYKMGSNPNSDNSENSVKDSNTESNTEQSQKSDNEDGNYFETLTDLMARGKSMKCTYNQKVDSENTADGTIYMSGGNARTEIIANKGTANEAEMYAIINKDWVYSWTNGSSTGYKMTVEASELDKKNKEAVSDLAKEINFKCASWKKDSSKFKIPSNINFQDMSEMMEGLEDIDIAKEAKNAEAQAKEFICNHCKNAPPEEMEECLDGVVCD